MKKFSWILCALTVSLWANEAKPAVKPVPAPAPTSAPVVHAPEVKAGPSPDDALRKLIAGNQRYVNATLAHEHQTAERRSETSASQSPFAVIVSCSDSRVPPEVIFDQGVGDLFVVRSAGEVVTEVGIGSIEYAVEHLNTPLILVMGHERCGAVKATVDGGDAPGSIGSICALIKPAVDKAKTQGGDILDAAIKNNVSNVADKIAASPIIKKAVAEGRVKIMKGYYDLDEGVVKPVN